VLQVGTPQQLFEQPVHRFVGWFIGSPGMNFVPASPCEGGVAILGSDAVVELPGGLPAGAGDGTLEIGIRPEFLELRAETSGTGLLAAVERIEDLGNYKIISVRIGAHALKVKTHEDAAITGDVVRLGFPPEQTKLYLDGRLAV
jgi:glycerol transport system ATP-binding protein